MKKALCIAMMFVAAVAFTQAQGTFQSQESNTNQAQLQGCCGKKKCCTCTGDILNCACTCATCAGKGCTTPPTTPTTKKTKKRR